MDKEKDLGILKKLEEYLVEIESQETVEAMVNKFLLVGEGDEETDDDLIDTVLNSFNNFVNDIEGNNAIQIIDEVTKSGFEDNVRVILVTASIKAAVLKWLIKYKLSLI